MVSGELSSSVVDGVFEPEQLFQWASTIKIQNPTKLVCLVQSGHHHYFIKYNLFPS